MIFHWGNQVRLAGESDPAAFELAHAECNISAAEIYRRCLCAALWALDFFDKQADTAAVKECEIAEAIQMSQPEYIAVKGLCFIDILNGSSIKS